MIKSQVERPDVVATNKTVQQHAGLKQPFVLNILWVFILSSSILFINSFDVLGLSTSANKAGAEFLHEFRAHRSSFEDKSGAIFVLDEQYLRNTNKSWPISGLTHEDLLYQLADFSPSAIVIDLLFVDEGREGIKRLSASLLDLSKTIPIFIVVPSPQDDAKLVASIEALKSEDNINFVSAEVGRNIGNGYEYLSKDEAGHPTVAWAVAQQQKKGPEKSKNFEIRWTLPSHPMNCISSDPQYNQKCLDANSAISTRPGLSRLITGKFQSDSTDKFRISPLPKILASDLLDSQIIQAKGIRGTLEGNTIFYGVSLSAAGDILDSPIYGRVEGVQYHAVGYANIRSFGEKLLSTNRTPPALLYNFLFLMPPFLTVVIFRYLLWRRARAALINAEQYWRVRGLGSQLAITFGACISFYVFYSVFHQSPYLWFSLFLSFVGGNLLFANFFEWIFDKKWLNRSNCAYKGYHE